MRSASKHIAIGYNTSHYIWILRANLIRELIRYGYRVTIVCPFDAYTKRLIALGVRHVDLPMKMNRNPLTDLFLFWRFVRVLRSVRPDIYLGYTAKPNIYGSLAAQICGIPVINNIAGLGSTFSKSGILRDVMLFLYRVALRRSSLIFFQNLDDQMLFQQENVLSPHVGNDILPGSGVDLEHFRPVRFSGRVSNGTHFLIIARLLWEKGFAEFADAARNVKTKFPAAEFSILGSFADSEDLASVSRQYIRDLEEEGLVTHLGFYEDVREAIAVADCVVLPSYYREGTPRSLLEAAAMGRPIITTNSTGCRDTVDDGISGFICAPRDSADLAHCMEKVCSMTPDQRATMGMAGRKKMEMEYDERTVIAKYLDAIRLHSL